jgi:hypothetical protein
MTLLFSIKHDFDRFAATLSDFGRTQLPKATADALNGAAYIGRSIIRDEMTKVFDRPNRWTLGGIRVDRATPRLLEAAVGLRDKVDIKSRGIPASSYLRPEIMGGARNAKSHERKLRAAGVLPDGFYVVPTKHAQMDAHGNMKVSQVKAILAALVSPSPASRYFIIAPGRPQGRGGRGGGLPPAIYSRAGTGDRRVILPVAMLVRSAPTYKAILDFDALAARLTERYVPRLLSEAIDKAMRVAR